MDGSKQLQSIEIIQAKRKMSSKKKKRRNEPLRRMWSRGLPSLATNTVRMVAATLQIGTTVNENEETDDEEIFNIGEQVQAHIPDIVLNNLNDLIDSKGNILIPNEHIYEKSTLLFLDVSGFTSLTEQYSNDAHLGVDQLTHTLNSYFDKLVSEILRYHGDIYKFAGDAILALWTNDTLGAEQALKCALYLQEKCGAYQTDVGVVLRLKVALAYGSVRAVFIGTEEFKYYILTGDCVKDVNICEQICEPGDIMITRAVYEHVQSISMNCEFVPIKDETDQHIAVKYIGSIDDDYEKMNNSNGESPSERHQSSSSSPLITDLIDEDLSKKIDSMMKSFLLRCVYQRIERQQSLDYLSELRRVTISFINLDISDDQQSNKDLYRHVQKVFSHIYELTKMMGGVLTKALLFDKGWSFLCVFGLPGYTQGDDTANALKCAHMIHSTIYKQFQFINQCSIGVATGLTYCGVVGHVARCEYTVIGRKVNMAARLMCNYPNIISCDQETYYNSRLNSRFFQILPDKILKGMHNVGIIWQYDNNQNNEQNKEKITDCRPENYPLLGRRVELMIVAAQIMVLDEPLGSFNRRRDLAAIIFQGDDKIGRSRLLQFLVQSLAKLNDEMNSTTSSSDKTYIPHDSEHLPTDNLIRKSPIRVISDCCQLEQRFNEFSLLRSLLRQLFGFDKTETTSDDREQYLLRLFDINKSHDLYLRRNLFLLNDLLDVRFRRSHENVNEGNFVRTYETNINELLLHILNQLIESPNNTGELGINSSSNPSRISSTSSLSIVSRILFIIDDIHFADESSLKHLLTLGSHSRCLLILSMKPPTNNNNDRPASNTLQSISTDSRVYLRRLPGLELRYIATLGCQILSVHKLPNKLVKILNESCNGIPGFCEQILFDLLQKDKIYITENLHSSDHESNLIEGDPEKLLRTSPLNRSLFQTLFSRRRFLLTDDQRRNEPAFSRLCLLRDPTANDFAAHCQQNFQNYIMYRIDRLSEGESLLVKIAAVIGNTFSRTFLWQLVDPQSKKLININSCILDMMQRTVLECAYRQQQTHKTRTIKCFCLQNPAGFPSQCRLMAFTHVSIREGIYNSLTDTLKRILTRNAIDYLENQCTIVCLTCGPRNDNPFFVQKQDDLTRMIKTNDQHAFVDIVKMAALKEIDNTIKHLIKIRSVNIRTKQRSNTSSNLPSEPITAPVGCSNRLSDSSKKNEEKRRNSFDTDGISSHRTRRSQPPFDFERIYHRSSNPNLTLTTVYPCDNHPSDIEVQGKSHRLFSLLKVPKQRHRLRKTLDGLRTRKIHEEKTNCFRTFFRFLFCQYLPFHSNRSISMETNNRSTKWNVRSDPKLSIISQDSQISSKISSHWGKVRQALIPSPNKVLRACPNDNELLEQSMFSSELMARVNDDLDHLNKQIYLTQTFQTLYEQSLVFHTFQSYVQYKHLIQYVYERKTNESENPNFNEFVTYNDLRICQCADYVLTVYIKLVEYHTNLYEMYEKVVDDRRDYLRRKEFDRMIYYRMEICQLLLRLNCLQRLLVEIENGRKLLKIFHHETINKDDYVYKYQYILTKYTYNLFEAIVLQRTRSMSDAKILSEQSLKALNEINQNQTWEKLGNLVNRSSAKERRVQYVQSKESSLDFSRSSQTMHSDQFLEKYRLEYLICQFHLVQYHLSRHQSIESINTLIHLQYHIYPLTFSLPCTIILIEYFYCQLNYPQCSILINNLLNFWWTQITAREKLELGKLKSLSLIIELKQCSLESAILSGYFAKRLLTGCHENIFLIETCIHLTLALIGEMRISNIELILQHLEYLSEQTMNCYAKLWYYILVIDVAIELGYELLPITIDFLENISKYRKKLLTGPNQRSLLIVYSDCILAQIYIRLGIFHLSKIHFQQALHQIKYDQMHLSNIDFRFKRGLVKLIETQLLHWYHSKEFEEHISKNDFLLHTIEEHVNEIAIPWNRTRFFIYQAYYDRLINDHRRQENLPIDNDFNWESSLQEAENNAIKLDRQWIGILRIAWLKPVDEQVSFLNNQSQLISRPRTSTMMIKSTNRHFIRPSIPHLKLPLKIEKYPDEQSTRTVENYSHQSFVDWRLFLTNNSLPQFQLYILPVRV